MPIKTFKTKDLYFASVLYAEHVSFIGITFVSGIGWFEYEDPELCEEKYSDYIARKLVVNAKAYEESIKTLKNLIFQQRGIKSI